MSNWFGDIGKSLSHPFDLNKGWTAFQHIDPALTNVAPGLMSTEDKALSKTWGALGVDGLSNMFGKDSDNAGRGLRHRAGAALAYLAGSAAAGAGSGGAAGGTTGATDAGSGLGGDLGFSGGTAGAPSLGGGISTSLDSGVDLTGSGVGSAGGSPASGLNWQQLLSKGLNQVGKMGQQQQPGQGGQGSGGMQIDQNTGWYIPAPTQFNPNQNNYSPQQLAAMLRQG